MADSLRFLLEARGVSCQLEGRPFLKSVDLLVRAGERYAILGSDLQQLTQLLRILYGRSAGWSGDVFLLGNNLKTNARAVKPRIGVMPTQDDLEPRLTVYENLVLAGRYLGLSQQKISEGAWKTIAFANLEDESNLLVGELEPTQRKKLLFSRALLSEPEIVFVEPFSDGTSLEQKDWLWRAIEVQECSVVVASDCQPELEVFCDKVAVLQEGSITATGVPGKMIERFIGKSVVEITVRNDEVPYFESRLKEMDFDYKIMEGKISVKLREFHQSNHLLSNLPAKEHVVRSSNLSDVMLFFEQEVK